MHTKRPNIYLYHSSKIAKAGTGYDFRPEHPHVQIHKLLPDMNLFGEVTTISPPSYFIWWSKINIGFLFSVENEDEEYYGSSKDLDSSKLVHVFDQDTTY